MKCIICGKEFKGKGNNAMPLANGRCCNICDSKVIMERIKLDKLEKKIKFLESQI
jgi:DNA-directed RNA polymerase subunit RPC12/RpoP